jgi:tRNA(His) 5'-end guanylyltransferase
MLTMEESLEWRAEKRGSSPTEVRNIFCTYEDRFDQCLSGRHPWVFRADGVCFSKWTKKACRKPFDPAMVYAMMIAAVDLLKFSNCATEAYVQSDEISLLVPALQNTESQLIYRGRVNKINSIFTSVVTQSFNKTFREFCSKEYTPAYFDGRTFGVGLEEGQDLRSYLTYRQGDNHRNSVHAYAHSIFGHKKLEGKSVPEMKQMCFEKGKNWYDLPEHLRFGTYITKKTVERTLREEELLAIPEKYRPAEDELVKRTEYFFNGKSIIDMCKEIFKG